MSPQAGEGGSAASPTPPRLLFLVSQPRSGSTLTQRILANHPEIHTAGEPWVMLAPLLALRRDGLRGDYQPDLAREAMLEFLGGLPNKELDYYRAVGRFGEHLSRAALLGTGKTIFLDKTPRYYLVLDELRMAFPAADTILLSRNPVAVLCSILETWILPDQAWHRLGTYWQDLLVAPDAIARAVAEASERSYHLRYEDLVGDPSATTRRLCAFLGLPYIDKMETYGRGARPAWVMGDQTGIVRHDRPAPANRDRWKLALRNPQVWRLAIDYLDRLEPETLSRLGYDPRRLRLEVEASMPPSARRLFTLPLGVFVQPNRSARIAAFPVSAAMTVAHRLVDRARGDQPGDRAR